MTVKNAYDSMADRFAKYLTEEDCICAEEADAYRFGIEVTFLKLVHIASYLLIAVCMKRVLEFIVIFGIFYAFRKNTGGFHARTRLGCYLFSCTAVAAALLLAGAELSGKITMGLTAACLIVLFCISPVRHENRSLEEEEISFFRRRLWLLSAIYTIGVILMELTGYGRLAGLLLSGLLLVTALAVLGKLQQFCALMLVLFISTGSISIAYEAKPESGKELVIVTDCSQSMQDTDKEYIVFDFIKSLYAVLPRDYQIGMIAFNNEICAEVPLGSSYAEAAECLQELSYSRYGNAGAGLAEAVAMFGPDASERRILLISDGEIMMKTAEDTQSAALQFEQAVKDAQDKGILIDVIALGTRIEEGAVVYSAAEPTGGRLYELSDGGALGDFAESLLFEQWKLNAVYAGQIGGMGGELSVRLPDCLMSRARIVLAGSQQNENMTLNCEADRVYVSKGINYTVIDLFHPVSDEVKIQMSADSPMDVRAYLTAEYDFIFNADYTYIPEEKTADFRLELTNEDGQNMLDGHLIDNGLQIFLDGEEQVCRIIDGALCMSKEYEHDAEAELRVVFDGTYGNYYGDPDESVKIKVPAVEKEQPAVDWFFWLTLLGFAISLSVLFFAACIRGKKNYGRHRVIDEERILPEEQKTRQSEWGGKLQVYVIRNKEGIDYPPESINLFARCSRDLITLEWILDTCNLPLMLAGAEKILLRPGDDRSLVIRNNSRASVLMGRELLVKGRPYHLYHGEKVTFIFDREDAEIEVHYRDLRPNERQGR